MKKISDVMSVFHLRIKTLYDIEKQLETSLPKMAEAATCPELTAGLLTHLEVTREHTKRLEAIFVMLQKMPETYPGQAIRGLVADSNTMANIDASVVLRDELIAGSGRQVEHFEMACYLSAIEEARELGFIDAVELLEATLAEEVAADEHLEIAFMDNLKQAIIIKK